LYIPSWTRNSPTCVDVTIGHTLTDANTTADSILPKLQEAEDAKRRLYAPLFADGTYQFEPAAFDVFGAWGPSARRFLDTLVVRREGRHIPDSNASPFPEAGWKPPPRLITRLAFALAKAVGHELSVVEDELARPLEAVVPTPPALPTPVPVPLLAAALMSPTLEHPPSSTPFPLQTLAPSSPPPLHLPSPSYT